MLISTLMRCIINRDNYPAVCIYTHLDSFVFLLVSSFFGGGLWCLPNSEREEENTIKKNDKRT